MNAEVMIEVAKGVTPALLAGVFACVLMLGARKGRPTGDTSGWWMGVLLLGVGCAAGAGWTGGQWLPGVSGTTWLPTMALVACAAGLVRGERGLTAAPVFRVMALAGVAWMTVRSVAEMANTERMVIMAGLAVVGTAACWGLERSSGETAGNRGGWPSAAAGFILAFAASQVLIIALEVHAAAWVAAGVCAFFGVCLAAGLATGRPFVGKGMLTAAVVLLSGLMVHGWQYGNAKGSEVAVYAALLTLSALGPTLAGGALGEKARGWGGVAACALPALSAVVMAVIVRPPPMDL